MNNEFKKYWNEYESLDYSCDKLAIFIGIKRERPRMASYFFQTNSWENRLSFSYRDWDDPEIINITPIFKKYKITQMRDDFDSTYGFIRIYIPFNELAEIIGVERLKTWIIELKREGK